MKKTINNILFDESLNKLFGYNKIFNNFATLYNNNKLPKIIILTGDKGIGKFTFIFHFINFVLSNQTRASYDKENFSIQFDSEIIKKIKSNVEQNFNYLGCEKPYNVSVDSIRELKLKLSKTPLNNLPRFNVIDDVELINLNSANALLKLIEEPSDFDYFFLINNKNNKVIETLFSRSIEFKIFLPLRDKKNIFNLIKEHLNLENNFSHYYLEYSTPGNLLKFDYILKELRIESLENFDDIIYNLLEGFKKAKSITYLNLIIFLIDIKFAEIIRTNNKNTLKTIEIKNKIVNLFYQYNNFNLNMLNVFNQYKVYLNHVR